MQLCLGITELHEAEDGMDRGEIWGTFQAKKTARVRTPQHVLVKVGSRSGQRERPGTDLGPVKT